MYGEITGYYLHWLASGAVDVAHATRKARLALAWIARRYGGSTLAADTNPSDRRRRRLAKPCSVLFRSGDARRRSGKGRGARTDRVPDPLWSRFGAALAQFADGTAHHGTPARSDPTPLPQRWSTSNGPFLAKAASRILLAPARCRCCHRSVLQSAKGTLDSVAFPQPKRVSKCCIRRCMRSRE